MGQQYSEVYEKAMKRNLNFEATLFVLALVLTLIWLISLVGIPPQFWIDCLFTAWQQLTA